MHTIWLRRYLSPEDVQEISKSIHQIESKSQLEIVPVIVPKSAFTSHVPVILTLFFTCVSLVLAANVFFVNFFSFPLILIWAPLLIFYMWVSVQLGKWHWIQKILILEDDERAQVLERGEMEFLRNRVYKTRDHMGLLLMISLMERQALILADEGVARLISNEEFSQIINRMNEKFRRKKWATGFLDALGEIEKIAAERSPRVEGNPNELSNRLIVRDY